MHTEERFYPLWSVCLSVFYKKRIQINSSVTFMPVFLFQSQIPPVNGQMAAVQALPTDWLIYDEMTRAHRIASVRCCSTVTPLTVGIFGGCAKLPSSALQEPTVQRGR